MISYDDIEFEFIKGKNKAGGQHRNKTSSCVRATHAPTGISVVIDDRNQHTNKKRAICELDRKVRDYYNGLKAQQKKNIRDEKIHNTKTIRTYDFKKNIVKDHRTGKVAPLKEVLGKGRIDLLSLGD